MDDGVSPLAKIQKLAWHRGTFFVSMFVMGTIFISVFVFASPSSPETAPFSPETTFWFLKPPTDFPVMIQPGIRTGNHRTCYYTDQFVPVMGTKDLFAFANTKQVWDDSDSQEQNYGAGLRGIVGEDLCILGTHAFYDRRKTHYHNRFNQVGFGVEMMSFWFDTRFNMYYPLSKKKLISEDVSYRFGSTSLIKIASLSYEEPLRGFDYECGVLIPYISRSVEMRTYVGGYHYFSKISKDIHGFRGRIELRPAPGITIHTEINHDNQHATHTYVGGYIRLPFSLGNLFSGKNPFAGWKDDLTFWKGTRPLKKRMVDPVIRDLDIVAQQVTPQAVESFQISGITFVDNSNTTGIEDGSYEHPYSTIRTGIAQVYGDKYLYIRQGSDSYKEFAAAEITIPDGVTIWGSGYNGGYQGITATSNPVLDAENHTCLVSGNNCTVMGIEVKNTIAGGLLISETSNVSVHHNTFGFNTIMNAPVTVIASTTTVSGITIYNNTFTDCGSGAIYAQVSTASGKIDGFVIENNHITNATGDQIAITTLPGGIVKNLTIQNNVCDQSSSYAIVFSSNSQGVIHENIWIRNNICSSNGYGIGVIAVKPSTFHTVDISGNTITNAQDHGINIDVSDEDSTEITGLRITNNTIRGSGSYGIAIRQRNLGKWEGIVQRNVCTNNDRGLFIKKDFMNEEFNIDIGGGTLGSEGYNSFYENTSYDLYYEVEDGDPDVLKAEHNWWGQSSGPDPDKLYGNIDYTPWLTQSPS